MNNYYQCSRCGYTMLEPVGKCPKCGVTLILDESVHKSARDNYSSKNSSAGARCEVCRAPYGWFAFACKECGAWIQRKMNLSLLILAGLMAVIFGFISTWGLIEMARKTVTLDGTLPFFVLFAISLTVLIPLCISYGRAVMVRKKLAAEGKLKKF
jgi:hypothetical protein